MHITIGPGVRCDLTRLITTRLLVQANSGAGKSWLLRRILEQSHGKVQQIVIDPEGEFASLRERYDYVLAARTGGDTVADPRTAPLLAERLLEIGVSAILDIYELTARERVAFVRQFLDALVDSPKKLWHPVLVVLDEAHTFAPEKSDAESMGAVQSLCSRGRKRGFCAVLATQRLSKLSKDAAAELNNKLIGRTSLDLDMARAGDELGFTKADRLTLRDLDDGEFFAFGPALTRIVTKVKVGGIQTSHPKAGKLAAVVPPPSAKVKALLPKLSDLPAEAATREKTVAELRAELATTRRALTEAKNAQPKVETKTIDRPVLKAGQLAQAEKLVARLVDVSGELALAARTIADAIRLTTTAPPRPVTLHEAIRLTSLKETPRSLKETSPRPAAPEKSVGSLLRRDTGTSDIPPGEARILRAIVQFPRLDRDRLGVLTGYKRSSRDAYIQRLVGRGFIEANGRELVPLGAGVHALGPTFEPLPSGAALVEYWRQKLPDGERRIFDAVIASGGEMTRPDIQAATGYKRSSTDAYVQRLKARGIVDTESGHVSLTEAVRA